MPDVPRLSGMKHLALIAGLAMASLVVPLTARAEEDSGTSLMERGMQLFFEGLMQEIEPAWRDLQGLANELEPALRSFVEEMGPALEGLMADVKDWSAYHPPEVLPNGDIILRKKTPEELETPETPSEPPREIDI
jgi:hypothetical protein